MEKKIFEFILINKIKIGEGDTLHYKKQVNVEGITESYHFFTCLVITDSVKKHQLIFKVVF